MATFCDLSKAFDCVSHDLLMEKLKYLGIRDSEWNLIHSYLNNRKQCVVVNGKRSEIGIIKYGVPQGSVLGPILFLTMINDLMCNVSAHTLAYADDTTFLNRQRDIKLLEMSANDSLSEAKTWFEANGFHLNETKTVTLLLSSKTDDCKNMLIYLV